MTKPSRFPEIEFSVDRSDALAAPESEQLHDLFAETYQDSWLDGMRLKLGLRGSKDEDRALVSDLLDWMEKEGKKLHFYFPDASRMEDKDISDRAKVALAWHSVWAGKQSDPDAIETFRLAVAEKLAENAGN